MIYTCLPVDLETGWGVCGHYVNRELARLRLIALIPPHCPSGHLDGPLLCGMFPHSHEPGLRHIRGTRNCGYTFFERNFEATRNIANAWRYWDWVATGSSWCERWLREAGYPTCSTVVQGVDHAIFHSVVVPRDRRRFVVFSGGCFQYRKAQNVVVAAMRVMMQRHPDVHLAAAWETSSPQLDFRATMAASRRIQYGGEPLAEACASNGLDMERVRLYPATSHDRMAQLYHDSDVGLFPNRCEEGTDLQHGFRPGAGRERRGFPRILALVPWPLRAARRSPPLRRKLQRRRGLGSGPEDFILAHHGGKAQIGLNHPAFRA